MTTETPASKRWETAGAAWIAAMPLVFVFLWSTGFLGAKLGLPYAEPFTFLALRFLIVSALLMGLSLAMGAPWPRRGAAIAHLAVVGLLVHAAYLGGVFSAIHLGLAAGLAALITGLQPALTACVVGPLLNERVTARQWLGVALGFAGVLLVLYNRITISAGDALGVAFAVTALLGITVGTLYQKRFCADMDLRTGSAIQFMFTGAAMALLAAAFEDMDIQWTGEFLFALGWLVVVLSLGAVTLLYVLIRRGAAAKVASLFYLVPPVTAIFAFFMFGETLGILEVAGIGVTVLGVALVTRG